MTNSVLQSLESKIAEEIGNPDWYDEAGAAIGAQDELFKQLGALQAKLMSGTLSSADALNLKTQFGTLAVKCSNSVNDARQCVPR